MKFYGDDGMDAYVHGLELKNEELEKEVEKLRGIVKKYEDIYNEENGWQVWHAENGAEIAI